MFIYNWLRDILIEIGPFVGVFPYLFTFITYLWVRTRNANASRTSRRTTPQEVSEEGNVEGFDDVLEIEEQIKGDFPKGLTAEIANIVRLRPATPEWLEMSAVAAGILIFVFPSTIIYRLALEVNGEPVIGFIVSFLYLIAVAKYLIIPNSDLLTIGSRSRFGVQLTIRENHVHFSSWDSMEFYSPELTPGAKISKKSSVKIVESRRKGVFANRIKLRLVTDDGWIDLFSYPRFLFSNRIREQFSMFSLACTERLQNPMYSTNKVDRA